MIEIRHHDDDFIRVYYDDLALFDIDYETFGRAGMDAAVQIVESMARMLGAEVVYT